MLKKVLTVTIKLVGIIGKKIVTNTQDAKMFTLCTK